MEEERMTQNEANRLLNLAMKNNNMARAKEAISKGADPSRGGYKLLELAAKKGEAKIVALVLKRASKDELNNFAMLACINRRMALLLDIQAAGGIVRIDKPVSLNHQDMLRWLAAAGIKAKIVLGAFEAAEAKHKTCPELINNLLTVMKNSETPQKYQSNLNFLLAESAREGRLDMLKLYEKYGGDVKSIPRMDIEAIKKRGQGGVWGYLISRGVEMRD